jgi:hypothetical protein
MPFSQVVAQTGEGVCDAAGRLRTMPGRCAARGRVEAVVLLLRRSWSYDGRQPGPVLRVHPHQDAHGGFEVVAERHEEVNVVEVLVAAEAMGEVVAGIDGGEHFLAMGTEEAIPAQGDLVVKTALVLPARVDPGDDQVAPPLPVAGPQSDSK